MTRPLIFDLRYATTHYPGVGSYAVGLAEALLAARPQWPWRVLMPAEQRFDFGFVPESARADAPAPAPSPFLGQRALGATLRSLNAMIYHSPYFLRPWGAQCPSIVTVHDAIPLTQNDGLKGLKRAAYRWLVADAMKAERVVTDSEASREEIHAVFDREVERAGLREEKNPEVPEAILHLVVAHPGWRLIDGGPAWPAWPRPVVLTVGINKPHKNLETLIRALALIPPPQRPLLASAGPVDRRYPDAVALARKHGVADDVTALGMVAEDQLASLYHSATLFAFPTRAEGFGLPLLEALALGVPAIASDLPVLREIAGDAAWFVPSDDSQSWANAITSLLDDELHRSTMTQHGIERAGRFDYADSAALLIHEYEALAPVLAGVGRDDALPSAQSSAPPNAAQPSAPGA